MTALYNEIDPYAAEWLRNLIAAGHIAPGVVDERSIEDLDPDYVGRFTQFHAFAGIGVWSYALRRAGWPDERPIWTGSCPCQPFSAAGKGGGFADERHLWPAWFHLIGERGPAVVLGEQVASKDGLAWLDLVQADLEAAGYASGFVDTCSAGSGAPHIRQRLRFVAERVADAYDAGLEGRQRAEERAAELAAWPGGVAGGLADDTVVGWREERADHRGLAGGDRTEGIAAGLGASGGDLRPGPTNGFWRDADWLLCRDGKWRPVEASPQPLVDGSAEGMGRVRPEVISEAEEAVDAYAMAAEIPPAAYLRDVREVLGAASKRCWTPGRLPGLHEAPFLLALLRQFEAQGWRFAEGNALPRAETSSAGLRSLRGGDAAASASCERNLVGQSTREYSDFVYFLPPLLARLARQAWGEAYETYAEIGFPLGRNAPARVGRLRAYGNAVDAEATRVFIEAWLDTRTLDFA